MPELPELQAHAERLDAEFAGAVLAGFRAITFTALKTYQPDPSEAVGSTVTTFGRRGKYLLMEVGPVTFVVHLMQGGRLKPDEKQSAKPRGGIARWTFADGRALAPHRAGHRAQGRACGWWPATSRPRTRCSAWGPRPISSPWTSWRRSSPPTPCGCTASCATST